MELHANILNLSGTYL